MDGRETAGVRLDLGDLQRHADQIRQIAADQAERIVADARAERERLVSSAADLGFAKGFEEGRRKGYEEGIAKGVAEASVAWQDKLAKLEQAFTTAIAQFEHDRERMLFEAREDILTLALIIAQKVTHRIVTTDPTVVADQLAAALTAISKPTSVEIAISPDDEKVATQALPALVKQIASVQHADLVVDPALGPGSCVVRTAGGGVIDASVRTQIERIVTALAPAGPRGEAAKLELTGRPPEQDTPEGGAVAA